MTTPPRFWLSLLVLLIVVSASSSPRAQPRAGSRWVIIVAPDAAASMVLRLEAELVGLGYHTEVRAASATRPLPRRGREAASELSEGATLVLVDPERGVTLAFPDGSEAQASPEGLDASAVLRIVELLRARDLKVEPGRPARQRERPRSLLSAPEPRWRLGLGAQVGWAPGGPTPGMNLRLTGEWSARPWLSGGLLVLLPLIPARLEGSEGEAQLQSFVLGVGALLHSGRPSSVLRLSAGAGLGALLLRMSGTAQPPYVGGIDWVFSALPYVTGRASLRLSSRLRLVADALLGVALPRPVVSLAERLAGHWGQPLLGGAIGLELSL